MGGSRRRGLAALVCTLALAATAAAGEFEVTGQEVTAGYSRIRSSYSVTEWTAGDVRYTLRDAYTIRTVGGPDDGRVEHVALLVTTAPASPYDPGEVFYVVPEQVIEEVPDSVREITVTVTVDTPPGADSPDSLPPAVVSFESAGAEALDGEADRLSEEDRTQAERVENETLLAVLLAGSEVDRSAAGRNQAAVGDPVLVATGELTFTETDLLLRVGALDGELARTYRSGEPSYGSLGPGWSWSLDTRLLFGGSTSARAAAEEVARLSQRVAGAAAAGLSARISEAVAERERCLADLRGLIGLARDLERAYRELHYSGPLSGEVRAEADRLAAAAASRASEYEREAAAVAAQVDAILQAGRRELDRLRQVADELDSLAGRLAEDADRSLEHERLNERFAVGASLGAREAARQAGTGTVTVIDPSGYPQRFIRVPGSPYLLPGTPTTDRLRVESDGTFTLLRKGGQLYRYGLHGELRRIEDRNGNSIILSYDAGGRLHLLTDTRGREVRLTRDEAGRLVAVDVPGFPGIAFGYDPLGRLETVTDPAGGTVFYRYAEPARIVRVEDPAGGVRRYDYRVVRGSWRVVSTRDEAGELEWFDYPSADRTVYTAPGGAVTVHHFDASLRPTRIEPPAGAPPAASELYSWDETGNRIAHRGSDGTTTTASYDGRGNITVLRHHDGTREQWTWSELDLPLTATDRRGHTTRYAYDPRGNLVRVEHPDHTFETFTRVPPGSPAAGEIAAHTDRRGNTTVYSYDEHGWLRSVRDSLGPVASYEHDPLGRLLLARDALGNETRFAYTDGGRLAAVAGPERLAVEYRYGPRGDLVETVANGRSTSYGYDPRGLLARVVNALGEELLYEHRADGLLGALTARTAGIERRTEYRYDARGLLESVLEVQAGALTRYEYDAAGRPSAVVAPDGQRLEVGHSSDGRPTVVRRFLDDAPVVDRYDYYPGGPMRLHIDPLGAVTEWVHDPVRRTIRLIRPGPTESVAEFGPYGEVTRTTDATGRSLFYRHDLRGRLVEVRNDEHREASYAWDAADRLVSVTDGEGATWRYRHDARGRLTAVTGPTGTVRTITYNRDDTIASVTDASGRTTRYEYDAIGRLTALVEPGESGERRTSWVRHHLGELASVTDASGRTTSFVVDDGGRTVAVVDGAGALTRRRYDAVGRLLEETDPTGRSVSYRYDGLGRLVSVERAGRLEAGYAYDPAGNLIAETDGRGSVHRYRYDLLGRVVEETNRTGAVRLLSYDAAGRVERVTDFTGVSARYSYDRSGRPAGVACDDGTRIEYAYDRAGRIVLAANEADRIRFDWTADGLLERVVADVSGTDLAYRYDAAGRLLARVDGRTGTNVDYLYDAAGLLRAIDGGALGVFRVAHDRAGRLTGIGYPNGADLAIRHDAAGRVSATVLRGAGGEVLDALAHVRDPAGRRLYDMDHDGLVTSYRYDEAGRLALVQYPFSGPKRLADHRLFVELGVIDGAGTAHPSEARAGGTVYQGYLDLSSVDAAHLTAAWREIHPLRKGALQLHQQVWTEGFEYDEAGNRLRWLTGWGAVEYAHGADGRVQRAGDATYDHDAAGRLIRQATASGTTLFEYTALHRLSAAHTPSGTVAYAYDALGRRVARADSGSTSVYRYDGATFALSSREETVLVPASLGLTKPLLSGGARYLAPDSPGAAPAARVVYREVSLGARTLALSGDRPIYLGHDVLGSVRIATGPGAEVVERYRYDAFGATLAGEPGPCQPYGYGGMIADPATGLVSFGFRDYLASAGRFTTVDPIRAGPNWYAYADGDPINYVDPFGLDRLPAGHGTAEVPSPWEGTVLAIAESAGGRMVMERFGIPSPEQVLRIPQKEQLQDAIRSQSMYLPGGGGNFSREDPLLTWCNQASSDFVSATSPALFAAMTGGWDRTSPGDPSYRANANQVAANLHASAAAGTVTELTASQAHARAVAGYTVVAVRPAAGSGHVSVLRLPQPPVFDAEHGPVFSNVGGRVGVGPAAESFRGADGLTYYYDSRQDRRYFDPRQAGNRW